MSEIGETLRERRMSLKIDVHEVEEETKIRAKYLRALENEEYNLLPGSAYVKSFLKTYADYLGLDSRALLDAYRTQVDRHEEEVSIFRERPETKRRISGRWVLLIAALVIVAVLLFVVGAIGGGSGG